MTGFDRAFENALFDTQRAIRYHDQRKSFFDFMHRVTNVLTILMAGNVIFTLALPVNGQAPWWFTAISIIAVLMAACDLVIGYSSKSALHASLRDQFIDLETEIQIAGKSEFNSADFQKKRAEIEKKEPPVYCALDAVCYNEVVRATYDRDKYRNYLLNIHWSHRLTRHFFQWKNITETT